MYLFSVSKNGVAATEIQRHTGVTYKTAWRMGHKIRSVMEQDHEVMLEGTVEVDEVFIGGKLRRIGRRSWNANKVPVYGMVQRGGLLKAYVAVSVDKTSARDILKKHVYHKARLMTDDSKVYTSVDNYFTSREWTIHSKGNYVLGDVHTNTIEGFWSQLQRSLHGTHHSASKKWMQHYVDEFVFKYNHRGEVVFYLILEMLAHNVKVTSKVDSHQPRQEAGTKRIST